MTTYHIGSAWQSPDVPEPSAEDKALRAYLSGETDEVDHAMLRRRFMAEVMRGNRLDHGLRGVAEQLQGMASELASDMELPTRVSELYLVGNTAGKWVGLMTAAQLCRDVTNEGADRE